VISAAIERCAGIDVGKKFLAVCILVGPLEGEPRMEKRRYGTTHRRVGGITGMVTQ
jgi:hypothetical protein